jgi:hypothetical protein
MTGKLFMFCLAPAQQWESNHKTRNMVDVCPFSLLGQNGNCCFITTSIVAREHTKSENKNIKRADLIRSEHRNRNITEKINIIAPFATSVRSVRVLWYSINGGKWDGGKKGKDSILVLCLYDGFVDFYPENEKNIYILFQVKYFRV